MLDIATQIPNLKKVTFRRNISDVSSGKSGYTRDVKCPMDGLYTADGKLCISTYPGARWFDEDIKPYHYKIREIRMKNPMTGKFRRGKGGGNANRN